MRKFFIYLLLSFTISSCVDDRDFSEDDDNFINNPDAELIHYWSFNNTSTSNSLVTTTFTKVGGAKLEYLGNYFDDVSEGSDINLRQNEPAGSALRLRNPSGDFIISTPSTGYKDLIFNFATTRTSNGPSQQIVSYSTDGVNFTTAGLVNNEYGVTTDFIRHQIDLSQISGANNNANLKIKISFSGNVTGDSGNSRFDNITLDGVPTGVTQPSQHEFLHYWNFNDASSTTSLIAPNMGNGSLVYAGSYYDETDGADKNVLNSDPAGTALRLRNPSGDFTMNIPTTGHKDIKVKYAAMRTGSGSLTQAVWYSTDGTTFVNSGIVFNITTDFTVFEVDLSTISGVNNNPNFKLKLAFDTASATAASGNNRIDNLTVEGYTL
jgi:hypothetical protein